jgi:hypothetical protein
MAWSAFREQYLRRDENPVNCALRMVADVVEMISRKLRACTISEAARGPRQAQASTVEARGLDSNVDGICLGIDLQLLSLLVSRNRFHCGRMKSSITMRVCRSKRRSLVCVRSVPRRCRRVRAVNGVGTRHQWVPHGAAMPCKQERRGAIEGQRPVSPRIFLRNDRARARGGERHAGWSADHT